MSQRYMSCHGPGRGAMDEELEEVSTNRKTQLVDIFSLGT